MVKSTRIVSNNIAIIPPIKPVLDIANGVPMAPAPRIEFAIFMNAIFKLDLSVINNWFKSNGTCSCPWSSSSSISMEVKSSSNGLSVLLLLDCMARVSSSSPSPSLSESNSNESLAGVEFGIGLVGTCWYLGFVDDIIYDE
ncbi:hypothetical protein WICPIJ_007637 [Wickerhamomyces pijperi]|uniref:Uncharacterized protein n=1 Tax=Wickerhamomyces pijperi TaxID=599730 RepID=A0A9P8PZJ8_WICPI|nr:hypothetical protein WICPIJ_007637 [Wickerhamomyces pijperi]